VPPRAAADAIASGRMRVRQVAAEDFVLLEREEPFDLVVAVRVGALDGRHSGAGQRVLRRIATVAVERAGWTLRSPSERIRRILERTHV
jgi:hypothetical protein